MTSRRKSNTGLITIIVSFLCVICCASSLIIYALNDSEIFSSTAATQVLDTPFPIPTLIALTYSAAGTQTAMVSTPEPLSTATFISSENVPTATIFIFQLQTSVAQPTEYIYSTNTPFSLQTLQPTISQTLPPQSAVCSCSGDTLNCDDFNTHSAAQSCFTYCVSQGAGDIHKLDANNDGSACESLP